MTEEGRKLRLFRPLVEALDTFLYSVPLKTTRGPHIRDFIDLKRWMVIVFFALLPCSLVAIWNGGVQGYVYGAGSYALMESYLTASASFSSYFAFVFGEGHFLPILRIGLSTFLPILFISYLVGGLCEALFAVIRRYEISEGFLVTGLLFALILPSTIPYWMVAIGVAAGVIIGKEIFGGTGMNILNPALVCRAFLFFAFPAQMTGPIWVGENPTLIQESISVMNKGGSHDGVSQASGLNLFNISSSIKRIHVDAIALTFREEIPTKNTILTQFKKWAPAGEKLDATNIKAFLTAPIQEAGLGLSDEHYSDALNFAKLQYGQGILTDGNFFFGNRIGSLGETSILASLLGAFLLIITRIGSWRTMLGVTLGAYLCALIFQLGSELIGPYSGAMNPAKFAFPAYKHFLLGSLVFGLVFMATDPVSSPALPGARYLYGILVGALVIIIRVINPAFPEGVMLAILFGNVFAPLFDHYALNFYRRRRRAKIQT